MMILESDSLPAHPLKRLILIIINSLPFHVDIAIQYKIHRVAPSRNCAANVLFLDSYFPGQYSARFRNTKIKKKYNHPCKDSEGKRWQLFYFKDKTALITFKFL